MYSTKLLAVGAVAILILDPTPSIALDYTGAIRVFNSTPELLTIRIDGQIVGSVNPSAPGVFLRVIPGPRSANATNDAGEVRAQTVLQVIPQAWATWTISLPQGVVPSATASPPEETTPPPPGMPNQPSVHSQVAHTLEGGSHAVHLHSHMHPHGPSHHHHHDHAHPHLPGASHHHPYTFAAMQGGHLDVRNRHREDLAIQIGSRSLGILQGQNRRVYFNLDVGQHSLTASAPSSPDQPVFTQDVEIQAGGTSIVEIRPAVGWLRLVNFRAEAIEVELDEGRVERVEPSSTRDGIALTAGERDLVARVPGGGPTRQSQRVVILAGRTTSWFVRATTGSLRVLNRTGEALSLTIDARIVAVLQPAEERFLTNIAAGSHVLQALAGNGQVRFMMPLSIGVNETRTWVLQRFPMR